MQLSISIFVSIFSILNFAFVQAHGGGEGAEYIEFFLEHEGCAGCLYSQY